MPYRNKMWYCSILVAGLGIVLFIWLGIFIWWSIEKALSFINDTDDFHPSDTWEMVNDAIFWKVETYDSAGEVHPVNIGIFVVAAVFWPIPIVAGIVWGILLYLRKQKRESTLTEERVEDEES